MSESPQAFSFEDYEGSCVHFETQGEATPTGRKLAERDARGLVHECRFKVLRDSAFHRTQLLIGEGQGGAAVAALANPIPKTKQDPQFRESPHPRHKGLRGRRFEMSIIGVFAGRDKC